MVDLLLPDIIQPNQDYCRFWDGAFLVYPTKQDVTINEIAVTRECYSW